MRCTFANINVCLNVSLCVERVTGGLSNLYWFNNIYDEHQHKSVLSQLSDLHPHDTNPTINSIKHQTLLIKIVYLQVWLSPQFWKSETLGLRSSSSPVKEN